MFSTEVFLIFTAVEFGMGQAPSLRTRRKLCESNGYNNLKSEGTSDGKMKQKTFLGA